MPLKIHKNSTILITGASGMVGQSLVKKLNINGFYNLLLPTSVELNLLHQETIREYFNLNKVRFVIHLAGTIGGIGDSINRPVEFMYDNLIMGMHVIKAASENGVQRLISLGSSCVYPVRSNQPMKEDYLLTGALEPTNEGYSLAKISCIKLCEFMNKQHGLNYFCLMPPNLFGPNDNFDLKTSHVLAALLAKFHEAKTNDHKFVEVWGSGQSEREFLFVDDLSDAIIFFMNLYDVSKLGSFLNVGSNKAISIYDLSLLVKKITNFQGQIQFNSNMPDGMPKKLMDSSKANSLGWTSSTSLSSGISLAYDWYKSTQVEQTSKSQDPQNLLNMG